LKHWLKAGKTRALVKRLTTDEFLDLEGDFQTLSRPGQASPLDAAWRIWLVLGGRGAGKTRCGAEWVRQRVTGELPPQARRIALVAPTFDEARLVMIEGESGLMAVHRGEWRPKYEPSKRQLTWPNGAVAHVFSAEEPDGLRGPQFDAAWGDEIAKWKDPQAAFDMLSLGLRLGERPRLVLTTTPRPIALVKRLVEDAEVPKLRMRTKDNRQFLAKSFLRDMTARYGGTRLGRQELEGELIGDDPDALWQRDAIEAARVRQAPPLRRIVIAVDPPAGRSRGGNACGIVCAGLGLDGRAYVLDDFSVRGLRPAQWAARVVALYRARAADRVIAEVNQGGAMVEAVLREIEPTLAYRAVHASRGKRARAEPVAALYEQGRVSHAGSFPELEDEMCAAIVEGKSPDRLDALVWALTDLMLRRRGEPRIRVV
jgi:phage terminase large subunit-like protein